MEDSLRATVRKALPDAFLVEVAEEAEALIRQQAGDLIADLTQTKRRTVKRLVAQALEQGWSDATLQKRLKAVVGLDTKRAVAVQKYRAGLVAGGTSPGKAERMADAYARRLLRDRLALIADSEMRTALRNAQRVVWRRMQERGDLSPYAVRVTRVHKDERLCPVCRPQNGRRRSLQRDLKDGPPFHPRCRCDEVIVDEGVLKTDPALVYKSTQTFNPRARDGDGDGLVQDGTPWERPATPMDALVRPPVGDNPVVPQAYWDRAGEMQVSSDPVVGYIGEAMEQMGHDWPTVAENLAHVGIVSQSDMREMAGGDLNTVGGLAMVSSDGWSIYLCPDNIRIMFDERGRIGGRHDHVSTHVAQRQRLEGVNRNELDVYTQALFVHEFAHLMHMHVLGAIRHAHNDDDEGIYKTDVRDKVFGRLPDVQQVARWAEAERQRPGGMDWDAIERLVEERLAVHDAFSHMWAISKYADTNQAELTAEYITAALHGLEGSIEPLRRWLHYRFEFQKTGKGRHIVVKRHPDVVVACTFHEESVADMLVDGTMARVIEKGFNTISPGGRPADDSSLDRSPRKNWVENAGGLPRYIRMVAHAMMRKGRPRSVAIRLAIGIVRNWATHENVSPKVKAAAIKAMAEWEAKKAKARVSKADTTTWNLTDYRAIVAQLQKDGCI